jgi:hypothetical protein
MKISTPFESRVPTNMCENLRWRAKIFRKVRDDPGYAEVIKEICSRDPIFFTNGFAWTHDPRSEPFSKIPFILYPYQRDAILDIIKALNSHDLLIEKSRDTGASWINCTAIYWCWNFRRGTNFLFGSRIEDDVDKSGYPKALFYKIDFILDNLPIWMKPIGYNKNEHRRHLHIENPEMYSSIDGEATTTDFARGGRYTAILLDEFASVPDGKKILSATRDATKCRLFNSTPKGTDNAFYDRSLNTKKLRIHWSSHPIKAKGLYTKISGEYKYIDVGYWDEIDNKETEARRLDQIILDRGVDLSDGKYRSPWYAEQCARADSSQEIAQELDIDYLGSGFQYFNAHLVNEAIKKHARLAAVVGDLEYDGQTGDPIRFRESEDGKLRLWFLLDKDGKPSIDHKVVLACDISAGTGASNSCCVGWDDVTHAKILEYVSPNIRPEEFAKQVVAIAKWIGNPMIIWESGGPGRQFGSRVHELHYGNVYLRKNDESIKCKVSDIPGVAMTKEIKLVIMGNYRSAIEGGKAINTSREALEECLEYVFSQDGGIEHARSKSKVDPSGAKLNHGDRAIADALAWKLINEKGSNIIMVSREIPVGCLKWRQQMREKKNKRSNRELSKGWA